MKFRKENACLSLVVPFWQLVFLRQQLWPLDLK